MRSWIVTLIIVASVRLVNAETLAGQIKLAMRDGQVSSFTTDIADHMGIERGLTYRALEIERDGTFHDFHVIFKDEKPLCVVLMISSDTANEADSTVYRLSLKGSLDKVFTETGRFDAGHKPIRGSGVITDLKITSEVRKAFQHELDFWLKGLYRKPANVTPIH